MDLTSALPQGHQKVKSFGGFGKNLKPLVESAESVHKINDSPRVGYRWTQTATLDNSSNAAGGIYSYGQKRKSNVFAMSYGYNILTATGASSGSTFKDYLA